MSIIIWYFVNIKSLSKKVEKFCDTPTDRYTPKAPIKAFEYIEEINNNMYYIKKDTCSAGKIIDASNKKSRKTDYIQNGFQYLYRIKVKFEDYEVLTDFNFEINDNKLRINYDCYPIKDGTIFIK